MKKSKVVLCLVASAGGFLVYKYGKSFYGALKNSKNRQPLEEIAKEIKETMIKNVDDIRKNTEELKEKVEDICNEAVNTMLEEEDFFLDIEEENKVNFAETKYVTVPMKNVSEKTEELSPLDVKASENPEEVRKVAVENLNEAEKAIEEELKPTESPAQILKAKRAKGRPKKVTIETKVEEKSEPVVEEKSEVVEEPMAE